MITWSQQYSTITKIFYSFTNGKKISGVKYNDNELERGQYFLRPEKYESLIKGNFIILVLHTMFHFRPSSKIELLKMLNEYKKQDIDNALKLKSEAQSYNYLINQDENIIKSLTINPYEAYKMKKISVFGVAKYYTEHPDEVKGRIMKKEVQDTQVLVEYFNMNRGEK